MKNNLKEKNISSALIMCRPNLKGFFYSKFLEFFFNQFLSSALGRKKPLWTATVNSNLGNSALILLPQSTLEMKSKNLLDREKEILKGILLANKLGTKKIAFAGLLPSLLNHFNDLTHKELIKHKEKIIRGQTMTCVGVGAVFAEISKKTSCKTLSVIGLGSIGKTCLHLLLEQILRPEKIVLCDLPKRKNKLEELAVVIEKKYSITTETALYGEETFLKVYEGDMFLGASSSKNVLNPSLLKKGTVLVDDSFPPIIPMRNAINRMKNKKDLLILSGGRMVLPSYSLKSELWQIPQFLISLFLKHIGNKGLPGCWLEALVYSDQKTQFFFQDKDILKVWELKNSLNLTLPDFHFFKYQIPSELIDKVCKLRKV